MLEQQCGSNRSYRVGGWWVGVVGVGQRDAERRRRLSTRLACLLDPATKEGFRL
jgi:hypothetical protein